MVANLSTKLEMLGRGTVKLVRERSEKTVAITDSWGRIQAQERKLVCE